MNSSLVCATAPNSTALIVGRAIAGIGVGGLFSGAIVILAYCCKYKSLIFSATSIFIFSPLIHMNNADSTNSTLAKTTSCVWFDVSCLGKKRKYELSACFGSEYCTDILLIQWRNVGDCICSRTATWRCIRKSSSALHIDKS